MKVTGNSIKLAVLVVSFLLTVGMVTTAFAAMTSDVDATAAESIKGKKNVVGLGVGMAPDYEGSEDYNAVPLLQLRFNFENGMYFSLLGTTMKFNVIPDAKWNFGPLLRYRAGRSNVDNDKVDDMKNIDPAYEFGGFLTYNLEHWVFTISAAKDFSDAHDGSVVDFGAGYRHALSKQAMFTIYGKGSYASNNYMGTYFSVDSKDSARSGLKQYDADKGFKDFGLGALMQYNFTENWGLLGVVQYTKLINDAKDSPVVDDEGNDNQMLGGLILNYRF